MGDLIPGTLTIPPSKYTADYHNHHIDKLNNIFLTVFFVINTSTTVGDDCIVTYTQHHNYIYIIFFYIFSNGISLTMFVLIIILNREY